MIDSITRITLNLQETNTMVSIRAKRGDTGRKLLIHLSDGSIPYHISDDCYATFTAKKPDGTKINNACTIENNVIEYEFTDQTCTAVGTMKAEIRLYGADDKMITSACFLINVYDTVFRDGDEVDSEGEMNTLDALICEANELIQNVQQKLDNGDFVGETGPQGPVGATGPQGPIGPQGETPKLRIRPISYSGPGGYTRYGIEIIGPTIVNENGSVTNNYGTVWNGEQGPAGDDYVLTDADKTEIAEMAADLVEVPEHSGGNVDQAAIEQAVADYLEENPIEGGTPGKDGADGADGFSPVATVEQTATGAVISITDKDGTTTATITNGKDGKDGADGAPGADGAKGDKGDTGETGAQGEPGKDGANGKDGTSATHSWNGTVLTVTSASGTSSADLKGAKGDKGDTGATGASGKDGINGQPGADGVSPMVTVSKSGKVTTLTITDKNGTKTATINDGADGKDGTGGQMDNGFGYTPTGGSLDESHLEKMRYWNAPIYDGNIPVFRLTEEKPAMTDATCTPDALYAMYDALAIKHPEYIKKYDMGLCSDGVQHVYRYDFVEPDPHHSSDSKEWDEQKIKIIIGSGIHWEWGSMFGLFNALEEITENEELWDLRRNVHLIVIPCMNPYSALHGSMSNLALMRQNANGVEIHRNFEVGFKYPGDSGYYDPSSIFHGGTAPLSEVESQYIDKIMRENTDAALFMSCHGYDWSMDGGTDDRGIGFILVSAATAYTCNMGYRLIDKLSRSWMADYGDTLSAGIESYKTAKLEDWDTRLGFAYMSSTNGSEQRQGTKYGIQSANVEMCETFAVHGTRTSPEEELSSFTMSRGTEVYINYLLMIAGCYDFKDKAFYGMDTIESEIPETPYEPIEPGNPEPDEPYVPRLPEDYQEVEYIYNTAEGPYIKTGINGKTGLEIRGTFMDYADKTLNDNAYIVGSTNGSSQRCYVAYNDVIATYDFGAIAYKTVEADTMVGKISFTAKWETIGCTLSATNLDSDFAAGAVSAFDNGSEMTIWGRNKSGNVSATGVFYLYSMEFYENGVQTRNFVPCYRKSDNVVGLYDIVNNAFYANSGTGTFLKGADV